MIVARDTELQFRFPVGKQYVIVALHLKHGDDAEEALRSFFVQEDIPVYMEMPILATAYRILNDPEVISDQIEFIEQLQYSVHETTPCTKLVHFYEDSWKHFHDVKQREGTSTHRDAAKNVKKGGFEHSYHQICNRSIEDCERVILFQHKQQRVVQKLLAQRKEEQDSMHANQSDEMNKATATNQINISALVEKHMAELDELERKYKDKLLALNKKQSVEFREFIQKYHSIDHATETLEPELEDDPVEQKWHRRWFKLRDQPSESEAEERAKPSASPTRKKGLEAALTVSIGQNNPVLYNIELNTLTPTEILQNTQSNRISLIKTARTMFSKSLTAMVVISDPSLNYKGRDCAQLLRLSENQTDPIFDSLAGQIEQVRTQTIGVGDSLDNGDYFVTRHSNMGEFQVLFHFMGESGRSPSFVAESLPIASESGLIEGLRNVMDVAFRYDVATITIPLLLCADLPEHLQMHPLCLSRAYTVMRAIRSILLSSTDSTLKTIRLSIPSVTSEFFEKYKAAAKNVFH